MSTAGEEKLSGSIERVTFYNVENGFAVLRVLVGGGDEIVTLVGHTPTATPGELVEAVGQWTVDRERGPQFKADQIKTAPPASLKGLEKFLGSGSVKSVGPQLAAKIVQVFGEKTAEVLDSEPSRLLDIRGIGSKRMSAIKESWREQRNVRELMVFLAGNGLASGRAVRIHRTYGDDAIALIRENPYRLAEEIRGIGFKTADELALKLGAPTDSPFRLRAALSFALQQLTQEGHVGFPENDVLTRTQSLVGSPLEKIAEAAVHEIERGRLVRESVNSTPWLFLAPLHQAEVSVARAIERLMRTKVHPFGPAADWDRTLTHVEKTLGFTLAAQQREAIRVAAELPFSIVTGGPGVGKTTLVRCLLALFAARGLKALLAAPTGRAAKRLSESSGQPAQTIHRLLEFDATNGGFLRGRKNPLQGDLFVIDEASMLDTVLASQLLQAIPTGAAVVLVGDADQLPSVGPGAVLADLIESGHVPTTHLNFVFRQGEGSQIVEAAHAIRSGRPPPPTEGDGLSDFYFIEADDPERIIELIHKVVEERIPARFGFDPLRDVQLLAPMNRGLLGARNLNQIMQASLNPPGGSGGRKEIQRFGVMFRVGDRVLQTVNNYQRDVFNGDLGVVSSISEVDQELELNFEGRTVSYDFNDLDELSLAYCLTIHKSQGSEYPCVVMPLHTQHYMLLQRNLVYTGLTRGKKLVVIVGSKRALALAASRQDALRRCTGLASRLAEL